MRAEDLLLAWDPLGYGLGSYGPEFDDIALALTHLDSVDTLNEAIRRILTDAFDDCPTESETQAMATRLLASSESCQLRGNYNVTYRSNTESKCNENHTS